MKSISIKTNNNTLKEYLINKLNLLDSSNILFSCYRFKIYDNIIIHYLKNDNSRFLREVSTLLSNAVIDIYENTIIQRIINTNYFYFSNYEQKDILKKCNEELEFDTIFNRHNSIAIPFYKYLSENKSVVFEGFITFRLNQYIKFLDSIIDISVNKFIIDKEYLSFIELLKDYISSKPTGANVIHLIYTKDSSTILDEDENLIEPSENIFNNKYLSDINFSSNDYALNTLLTIIPKKLVIHTSNEDDEFINTLKLIFDKRVTICK